LDPETAKLRQAWTALGRLIEAAQPTGHALLDQWKQPPAARPQRSRRLPIVALAVSLAACAVALWAWRGAESPRPARAPSQQAATVDRAAPTTPKVVARTAAASTVEPQWDDTLDEQFSRLGQRLIRVEQDWTSQAVANAVRQYEWEQVRQSVSGDRL
jgi:hypothetical protein